MKSVEGHVEAHRRRKAQRKAAQEMPFEHDEHFAYIAGYTEAGFAFGITWEEWEQLDDDGDPSDVDETGTFLDRARGYTFLT